LKIALLASAQQPAGDEQPLHHLFIDVFLKRQATWQAVAASQATPLP